MYLSGRNIYLSGCNMYLSKCNIDIYYHIHIHIHIYQALNHISVRAQYVSVWVQYIDIYYHINTHIHIHIYGQLNHISVWVQYVSVQCNSQKYTYLENYTPGIFSRTKISQKHTGGCFGIRQYVMGNTYDML